jgi:LPXTG-motif cell wall-anchored protein
MNPTETTKETEFIFRRLGDSFTQFATDLWQSVPVLLLALAAILLVTKGAYAHARRSRGASKPDPTENWLWWGTFLSVATLVTWTLITFYQRDTEQVKSGPASLPETGDSNSAMWYSFVGAVFALGSIFVVWMYVKDSKSIRWFWAAKLAILRIAVYAILCFVFLLPAKQTWERTEKKSRVVIVLDISPSMTRVSDEVQSVGRPIKTRMDVLLDFLTDEKNDNKVRFIQKILENNPLVVYPFGTRLDESSQMIGRDEKPWDRAEWEAFATYDFRPAILKGLSDDGRQKVRNSSLPVKWDGPALPTGQKKLEPVNWADWAAMWVGHARSIEQVNAKEADSGKKRKLVADLSDEDDAILLENLKKLDRRVDVARTIALGTNVPDSVTAAVNRESPNMVQGIVVFSDGRSNLGSDSSYRELRDRAVREKIPVFTVAVGEDRQTTGITIAEIQADETAQPDQGFKSVIYVDGLNLAGKTVDVEFDVFYLGQDDRTADGKPKELSALTSDFTFNAATNPKKVPYQVTFAPGEPPTGQIEFEIDPEQLSKHPAGARLTEESKDTAIKKRVLKEGKWAVRARIPKHPDEVFAEAEHVKERTGIQVIQRKLRVLVVASAPSREFQFLRTFLVREVQDNRAAVTILVQNEAGKAGQLTPNPTEEIIPRFPDSLDLTNKLVDTKDKPFNLNEYDLIVAFDPDWSEITRDQADMLQTWVQRQGGGLIYVADRINTFQLIRRGTESGSPLYPILDILPVLPDDVIAVKIQSIARTPRRLYLNPIPGSDLLKIDDPPADAKVDGKEPRAGQAQSDPIAGWEDFFTGRAQYEKNPDDKVEFFPKRGFFSCYPVKEVKPGAHVLAEFAVLEDRGEKVLRPWLVTNNPSAAWRTAFMGSGEIYRMYAHDKEYYERFWGKLMKYMAAKRNVKATRGRVLVSKEYISGTPIRVQAQVLSPTSKPYPQEGAGAIDLKFNVWSSGAGERKLVAGAIPMTARPSPGGFDGYYAGQITADAARFPPGDTEYQVETEVPEGNNEKLSAKFLVVKSDPELDNTRPSFEAMRAMASDYNAAFWDRIPASVKERFNEHLPKEGGVQKLSFHLADTELLKLIPDCFISDYQQFNNKGPVTDLWDKGIEFPKRNDSGTYWERNIPSFMAGRTLSWVMILVVGLLCWEWLTRKLLRLA